MTATSFDTLKYATSLKKAGVAPEQAEAQAIALAEVLQSNLKDLVTKDDLKYALTELRTELKNEIVLLRTEFSHQLRESEQRQSSDSKLIKWMIGFLIPVCVAVAVRMFFFPR